MNFSGIGVGRALAPQPPSNNGSYSSKFFNNTQSFVMAHYNSNGQDESSLGDSVNLADPNKRKSSTSSSKKQFVPVLDMKKVAKQFMMVKSNAMSIRDSKDQMKKNDSDSTSLLYKNLASKLSRETQSHTGSNNPSLSQHTSSSFAQPTHNIPKTSKHQVTKSTDLGKFAQPHTSQIKKPSSYLAQANKAASQRDNSNVSSVTNKNHKSFVFPESGNQFNKAKNSTS